MLWLALKNELVPQDISCLNRCLRNRVRPYILYVKWKKFDCFILYVLFCLDFYFNFDFNKFSKKWSIIGLRQLLSFEM
jgi:hypothetical protein